MYGWSHILKLLSTAILLAITLPDTGSLMELGLTEQWVYRISSFAIGLFTLAVAFDTLYSGTPILRMANILFRKPVWFQIDTGGHSDYLKLIFRECLYIIFGANLLWVSYQITVVKYPAFALGLLLMLVHLLSLGFLLFRPDVMSLIIWKPGILYMDNQLNDIPWEDIQRIDIGEQIVTIWIGEDMYHEMDFSTYSEDFQDMIQACQLMGERKNFPVNLEPVS